MTLDDYAKLDATALAALVHDRKKMPQDIVAAAIEAIEALNPKLNAVVLLDKEQAMKQAAAVDRDAPLAGVPCLIKDNNVYVEGWPTTFSCRFFEGAPSRPDSELIRRLRKAGLVILGKTNTPEFAADWTTEPTLRGPTRNPWNRSRSPGGSSGGSAAAVASRMVPIAHGNDNAGSIRVPAAVCGIFGLKPSRGLVPIGPYFPELAAGHDCEHVLTRSVRDSAALLDLTGGPEPGGRYRVTADVPSFGAILEEPLRHLEIGLVLEAPAGIAVDDEIAAAVAEAARLLERAGHRITDTAFPEEPTLSSEAEKIWHGEIGLLMARRARELGREPRPDEMEALTADALQRTAKLGAVDYLEARQNLHEITVRVLEQLSRFDLLLTPTTAELAPPLGHFDTRTSKFDHARNARLGGAFAPFTETFSVTGQPAASMPVGLSKSGLPIGAQLVGQPGRDDVVLRAAFFIEKAGSGIGAPPCSAGHPGS
ncbi:MAG: amidase [Aestuariivirgaceae bacterium]